MFAWMQFFFSTAADVYDPIAAGQVVRSMSRFFHPVGLENVKRLARLKEATKTIKQRLATVRENKIINTVDGISDQSLKSWATQIHLSETALLDIPLNEVQQKLYIYSPRPTGQGKGTFESIAALEKRGGDDFLLIKAEEIHPPTDFPGQVGTKIHSNQIISESGDYLEEVEMLVTGDGIIFFRASTDLIRTQLKGIGASDVLINRIKAIDQAQQLTDDLLNNHGLLTFFEREGGRGVRAWEGLFPSETLRRKIDALTEGDYLLGKGFTKSDLNGFATYVDNAFPGTKSTLTSRINSGSGFNLIHTDEQIQVIMLRAKSLNLPADEIDDLLLVSCRSSKPIPAADLMQQMDNWVNVVKARGYPYRFSSLSEFQQFGGSLKNKLGDVNVGTADVRVQGSSLRTPDANDVDLAAIITQSEFDNFMKSGYSNRIKKNGIPVDMSNMTHQDLVNLSNDISQNPSLYNGVAKNDFNYNFPNKIIKATPDKGVIPGLRDKLTEIQFEFPNLNVENITIQETGSAFDLEPFLNL